jgi:hypothetical protein
MIRLWGSGTSEQQHPAVEVEGSGRIRFEPIDSHVLRARVQATFDALSRAGLVAFRTEQQLPFGTFHAMEIKGEGPFKYTALIAGAKDGEAEQFFVRRSGAWLKSATQLAGPFSTMPFSPVPAESGTPVPAQLFAGDVREHIVIDLPRPNNLPGKQPLRLPPPVTDIYPQLLAQAASRNPMGAVIGFVRGFVPPTNGAQLAAA